MTIVILISLLIIVITIILHGVGSAWFVDYLLRRRGFGSSNFSFRTSMFILSFTAVFLMVLHYIEIVIWAAVYLLLTGYDKINSWEEAIYFSMVTYSTLGYGDITLPPVWRVMSGFEAMNGILLFGWSTAMFYAAVQKLIARQQNKH